MKPLKGVTVLDISRLLPGGFASLLLSELGARVIKIEQPGVGDYYRGTPETLKSGKILAGNQVHALNFCKESLGLDLKSSAGRTIFKKLVQKADVVIESFRPGILHKLGLSYSQLRRCNRRLILCSITGLGQKGSSSGLGGHDLNYLGLSGLLSQIRDERENYISPQFQVVDLASAQEAVFKITAALYQRTRDKKGVWIDVSMLKAGKSWARLYPPSSDNQSSGALLKSFYRYNIYETSDGGFITFAPLESKFWENFCRVVKKPEWRDGTSVENLRQLFRSRSLREWTEIGQREDVCLFPVKDLHTLPFFSQKKAPRLGAHSRKILRSLGYHSKVFAQLKKEGVIE